MEVLVVMSHTGSSTRPQGAAPRGLRRLTRGELKTRAPVKASTPGTGVHSKKMRWPVRLGAVRDQPGRANGPIL